MRKAITVASCIIAFVAATLVGVQFCQRASAEGAGMVREVVALQPWYKARRGEAAQLARHIQEAALRHDIPPEIGLAMAFCESSLLPYVARGRMVGRKGERGIFQVMPDGRAERLCGQGRSQWDIEANADTAMCYLAHVRDNVCRTDDPWVYVAAYSSRSCPTPRRARRMKVAKRRREVFCRIVGPGCEAGWPR
jgi:hypothetical protein